MAVNEPSQVTPMTQELRLATTMTGGVSLAIWMAGVAREINLLAQASQWRRVGGEFRAGILTTPAEESLKLYRQLIDLLDTLVDVDILSGTSAGGINGALLAWSRVRGSDLGKLRNIWMNLGALTELLRQPTDKTTPSLLYGDERMLRSLVDEIPGLTNGPFPPVKSADEPDGPSTTLYVTTTLLNGETSRFTDSFGTLVQDVDRRGVFTFTEKDLAEKDNAPAEEEVIAALALAARSSASFPAAFEPSFVPFTEGTPGKGPVPARPAMERFANITRPHWVADGGLLDNQPIDVLLKRIFDRPAERPVRRVLLFVVPSSGPAPDMMKEPEPDNIDDPLGLVEGLVKDLAAITTQSIAADLRAIQEHRDRMEARTDAKLRLAELAVKLQVSNLSDKRLLTPSLLADYKQREATKQAQELTSALLRQLATWPPESSGAKESIPETWRSQLAIGGDAETVCSNAITQSILGLWSQSQDPPKDLDDLARYGKAAFDLVKACAISIVGPAYRLARSKDDFEFLAILTAAIHGAQQPPPGPIDLAQIVRNVCIQDANRNLPLEKSAGNIAADYLAVSTVRPEAWSRLGVAFVDGFNSLQALAESDRDPAAASQLTTYLKYLGPQDSSLRMATKLFELAAAQRAMLPAEADVDQSVELVQVSADTRSLLAPEFETAEQKLTGMQLHHFGAFYKRSWRANDWLWGRLDGAGWLVHILLDPRRVRSIAERRKTERKQGEKGSEWFLRTLESFGAPELPRHRGGDPKVGARSDKDLTRDDLLDELAFLDDASMTPPSSIPNTSLWLAQAWQQHVLDDELDVLARTVTDPQSQKPTDWSPPESIKWAEEVLATVDADAKYTLFKRNPVAGERFDTDKGSPLMARTLSKAAATASAAIGSISQAPTVVKPALATLRTITLAAYRVISVTKGTAKRSIQIGAALLVLGVALAIQSASWAGLSGLTMIAIGSYLVVLATWQLSSRTVFALLSATVVLLAIAPSIHCVATWLFGEKGSPNSSLVGRNLYWLSADWTHPLLLEGLFIAVVIVVGMARPDRWRIGHRRRRR
jgi:patatin-related protein